MSGWPDKKREEFALAAMGLDTEWSMFFSAWKIDVLVDDVSQAFLDEDGQDVGPVSSFDAEDYLKDVIAEVETPKGVFFVGAINKTSKEKKFALVDFSEYKEV